MKFGFGLHVNIFALKTTLSSTVSADTIAKPMVWIPRPLGLTDSKCINLKCKCHFLWINIYIYVQWIHVLSVCLVVCAMNGLSQHEFKHFQLYMLKPSQIVFQGHFQLKNKEIT